MLLEVAKLSAAMYTDFIKERITGLSADESAIKGGDVFREFLKEHKHLYELLIDPRWIDEPQFAKANEDFTLPRAII